MLSNVREYQDEEIKDSKAMKTSIEVKKSQFILGSTANLLVDLMHFVKVP